MKIAQVTHLFPPLQGGVEHHVYELSRELSLLGNEVTVYTTQVPGAPDTEVMEIEGSRILVRRFWSLGFPGFSSVRFSPQLFFALLKSEADVFASHGYGSPMPFFTAIAAWKKHKPFVFTLHGYPILGGIGGLFRKFYTLFVAPWFLSYATKIITVSKNTIPIISREVDPKKIIHVPNGVSLEVEGSFVRQTQITYVGRLDKDKQVDILLRAYIGLVHGGVITLQQNPLLMVGPDEGIKGSLREYAQKNNVEVSFKSVPKELIASVYAQAFCVVLPSKYEGFSLVWLEAMAAGRPMFSTPVGDANELFLAAYGKDNHLFLFANEEELGQLLTRFVKNPEKYKEAVDRAQKYVKENYSWPAIAKRTLQIYNESIR